MARVARRYGLVAGSSMDLTTECDFAIASQGERDWKKAKEEAPFLLFGLPPCTDFSMLLELSIAANKQKPG